MPRAQACALARSVAVDVASARGEVYDRTVDVQIRRLRLKIETDTANPQLILTERGVGYQLASDVETLY